MPRPKLHFKVHTSIRNHRKTRTLYRNNDLLAAWVRCGVEGVERHADDTGDRFLVDERELPAIMGTDRSDSARRALARLTENSPLVAHYSEGTWELFFPNFAKKQKMRRSNETITETKSVQARPTNVPVTAPHAARERNIRCPDPFPDGARQALLNWAPKVTETKPQVFSEAQVDFAIERAIGQSKAKGMKNINWVQAIQNYMRDGWILKGYQGADASAVQGVKQAMDASRRRDANQSGGRARIEETGGGLPFHDVHKDKAR